MATMWKVINKFGETIAICKCFDDAQKISKKNKKSSIVYSDWHDIRIIM